MRQLTYPLTLDDLAGELEMFRRKVALLEREAVIGPHQVAQIDAIRLIITSLEHAVRVYLGDHD